MEILLVEDNRVAARFAMAALEKGNVPHRLSLVFDGEEALKFLRQEEIFARAPRPDLVLLDLGLPKKDGREVLAELRADSELRDIPVVVVTASEDERDILATEQLGVDGYMTKPINMAQFISLIKKLKYSWHHSIELPAL